MQYIKEITVDLSGEMYFNYVTAAQGDENSRFVKKSRFFPEASLLFHLKARSRPCVARS